MTTIEAPSTQEPGLRRLSRTNEEARQGGYQYRTWEDLYRDEWTWDRVVKVTHTRANCNAGCAFDAYVKDGIVWREEQSAHYDRSNSDIPDYNPRGCTSGCAYSQQMYDPTRLKYPMKRIGARGSGRWQRLSWDEALTEIADRLIDVITTDGPDTIVAEAGTTNADFGVGSPMEGMLLVQGLGGAMIDDQAGVGDLPNGLIQSWGVYMIDGTADDWFMSDYIVVWDGNPAYTRQPEVHFMFEARYRGAKMVCISPDFSPTAMHADRWLNVRQGTDAALALAMVQTVISENLYDAEYIKEQTDLPFLVCSESGRYLRQSDVEEGGSDEVFYVWNAVNNRKAEAPCTWGSGERSIRLDEDLEPVLEGAHRVLLKDGRTVTVRTVFDLLKRRMRRWTPERAQAITGVAANNIRRVAREFAAARSAMIFSSYGSCKHYDSDLFQRGMVYLCALTGNSGGKPGSGIKAGSLWTPPSMVLMQGNGQLPTEPAGELPIERIQAMDVAKMMSATGRSGPVMPLIPWLYAHDPKWAEAAAKQEYNDPALPRPVSEYMKEVFANNWQPVRPQPPKKPRFFYFSGTNPLRRWPNNKIIRDSLWAGIETIVTTDNRMSTSVEWCDYVLPACGWYEKPGIKYTMSYVPWVVVGDRAVPPLWESRHEWDIILGLARKIQERAVARDIPEYTDTYGRTHNLKRIYDDMTADGAYKEGPEGEEKALDYIMKYSPLTRHSGLGENAWNEAVTAGAVKIKKIKPSSLLAFVYSDYEEDEPTNSCGWFVNLKHPWPTLTGRQQFYIDHPWFLEVGEEFATYRPPIAQGGRYTMRLTGGHTRWSIHSIFRANAQLLRLQRGEPVAYINTKDARRRRIADHNRIRIFNDLGSVVVRAKVSPSVQPGSVVMYHAWEGFQMEGRKTQNDLAATPMKPNNMVGDYGQLNYRQGFYTMNHLTKGVAVEIEKVRDGR